jgi:hypothetical protein
MVDLYFNCNDVLRSMRPELYDIGLAHHGAIMRLSTKVRPGSSVTSYLSLGESLMLVWPPIT